MNNKLKQALKRFENANEAISPVVATLLLVLVAAGAAIGFGVFLNGFQKDTQGKVSNEAPAQSLRIGGSSTVYDFSAVAKTAWEGVHPSVPIDLQKGGSGGGVTAVCAGNIDIGSSSDDPTTLSAWKTCPDLNADGVKDAGVSPALTKVAYDTIVMTYNSGSFASGVVCTFSVAQIKELYTVNLPAVAGTRSASIIDGAVAGTGKYTFGDLIDQVAGELGPCVGTLGTGPGAPVSTTVVKLSQRSDNSGTEGDFCLQIMADVLCDSSTHQLSDNSLGLPGSGNDGVGDKIAGDLASMGFMDGGGAMNPAKSYATKTDVARTTDGFTGIQPKTNGKTGIEQAVDGTYKTAVQNCIAKKTASATVNVYPVCRTLYYITIGEPQGNARAYLDFVTQTDNNIAFSNGGLFVPLY